MSTPNSRKIADLHLAKSLIRTAKEIVAAEKRGRVKIAGEVRFIKDRSGDETQWAFQDPGMQERAIGTDFNYSPTHAKPLARSLRSTLAALGHALSAYNVFAKIKSAKVSPDGALGGRGYIQKISEMRRQYMNTIEALSALADTMYDEVNAPHWSVLSRQEESGDKKEIAEMIEDAEEIRENPEAWAQEQIDEEFK
jgi:hypothetical protein